MQLHSAAMNPDERVRRDSVQLFLSSWRSSLTSLAVITAVVAVAGHNHAPSKFWTLWGAFAGANCLFQAAVCRAMERAPSPEVAIRSGLRWLLASIGLNGIVWGLMPWLVVDAETPVLLFACLFDAMLLFCISNAPGTAAMVVIAAPPITILGSAALMEHHLIAAGLGYVALVGIIAFYGLRLRHAVGAGMKERHAAEDLAVDLRAHQQRLVELERERTLLLERERLTRDMHDGLGSALVASLAAVERGELRPERISAMLRECVDDLRSVIDSLEPIDHDLVALLATLRLRVERRLNAAGVGLQWEMHDLPRLEWLGPPEALHVMRIVQEVLTNSIKHAGARHVRLTAQRVGAEVEVCIVDDGAGFDPLTAPEGRGMRSLKQRTSTLGGSIDIATQPGKGTTVRLRLPIQGKANVP